MTTKLEVKKEITYTIAGLTYEDMELLCLGLEASDDGSFDRKQELIEAIEAMLPVH